MRAALALAPHEPMIVVDDVELDAPRTDEVRVQVEACGMCHSDLSYIDGVLPGQFPMVLGHEAAGVVTELGPGVTTVKEGQRVVLSFRPPCKRCYWCIRGEESLCAEGSKLMSGRLSDGGTRLAHNGVEVMRGIVVAGFAEQTVVPAAAATALPDDIPLHVAALIGCAIQTGLGAVMNTADVEVGSTVLISGLGGIGMSIVQGAAIAGAAVIIGVDPVESRRELALRLGATNVIDPATSDAVAFAREVTHGIGVDYAFDAVGRPEIVEQLMKLTRNGGTTVMVGVPGPSDTVKVRALIHNAYEKKLIGCYLGSARQDRDIDRAIRLWRSGRLDLEGMISQQVGLADIDQAVEGMRTGDGLRWIVRPGQ
jgi:S-(hydroxymethyl)glutathione dehydrogenase / alcohol dehydrogenase